MLVAKDIVKTFAGEAGNAPALRGVSLTVTAGEFVAVTGRSGSGKSTLLNILSSLLTPDAGQVLYEGRDLAALSAQEAARVRNKEIGFVFQQFFLLAKLNALQNVELPLIYAGVATSKRQGLAKQFLEKVELSNRMHHLPSELSGGQKQRVAIARALVNNPSIILADEPTGALDTKTGQQIMELLTELNREGKTIIMVTHEPEIADYARRKIVLRDGIITEDSRKEDS